jgi:excisionase family DNA binding protein
MGLAAKKIGSTQIIETFFRRRCLNKWTSTKRTTNISSDNPAIAAMTGPGASGNPVSLNSPRSINACAAPCPDGREAATPKTVGAVLKIYTAVEAAGILRVKYKTVLRLIQRGLLKAIPGLRHKRITEQELLRYLGIKQTQRGAA